MIVFALATATAIAAGPGMRLGPRASDGSPVVHILNHLGKTVSRINCPFNNWSNPDNTAAALMSSTSVMELVIALDGRLASSDQLGPARYACILVGDIAGA